MTYVLPTERFLFEGRGLIIALLRDTMQMNTKMGKWLPRAVKYNVSTSFE